MWIAVTIAVVALLAFSYRYAWWMPSVDYRYPRILMYHMIAEHEPGYQRGLRVSPSEFEKQLLWLKREGWTFLTMSELMIAGDRCPGKAVVLTFDDGFEDNYSAAFPLLKKHGAKATLYLVVERHDRDWAVYKKAHHDSGETARIPKLSDEQVQEMIGSGIFEIGGHTLTHANLARLDGASARHEIAACRARLEERFSCRVETFAYPFGIYSKSDVLRVQEAGFTSAVTTNAGINENVSAHPFELKRVKISGKDGMFSFKLRMKIGKRGFLK